MAKNPTYHAKTKDIDTQYHFVRKMVENKRVFLEKFDTVENVVDSWRKFVRTIKFAWCREAMGIIALSR